MARRDQSRVAGGERAAYEKLEQSLRHGIEAATELGVLQSNPLWAQVAALFEQTLKKCGDHKLTRVARLIQQH